MEERIVVRVTRNFDEPPERVYDAWLDRGTARRFLFATPDGEMGRVEIDPRIGGRWVVVERRDGEEVEHRGEYLELERPRRIAFTLQVPKYEEGVTEVVVDIADPGAGSTVTISNTMDASLEAYRKQTEEGWRGILEGLAAVLADC
jgi:uncharacterized protein YndB with AHSA1/START domain